MVSLLIGCYSTDEKRSTVETMKSVPDAAGGAGQAESGRSPTPALRSFLFKGGVIVPVGGLDLDREDGTQIALILEQARVGYYEQGRNAPDKQALQREIARASADELEGFIANRPNSVWTPSLRNQLGLYYITRGLTSRAMDHWRTAWDMTAQLNDPDSMAVADFALAQYTRPASFLRTDRPSRPGVPAAWESCHDR
jgi:hypothetical protein